MVLDFLGETTIWQRQHARKEAAIYDIKYGNDVFGSDHTMFDLKLLLSAGEA